VGRLNVMSWVLSQGRDSTNLYIFLGVVSSCGDDTPVHCSWK